MALKLALLWHMHQPYYKNIADNSYLLPWVRLHALKDYYGMVAMLRDFPKIRQNFNLVPSLLAQLQDYCDERAREAMLDLSLTPAAELKESDKSYILRYFFYANIENLIGRYPRFMELLEKRGFRGTAEEMERARSRFSTQDFLDLQVLQKLAWMDEEYLESDPEVSRLAEKGKLYTEEDKSILREKELELLRRIIPEYREASERGQVELSTTPYYHPILPLLVSSRIARESQPSIQLPLTEFSRAEDARVQIQRAMHFHEEVFGARPAGCWPSEGSVSEHILPLLIEAGIKWIATDEEVLLHSIEHGRVSDKAHWCAMNLYTPYHRSFPGSGISIVFRDHVLSDLIGFHYSRVSPGDAAEDLMKRLHTLNDKITKENPSSTPPLVSIILDGENAWEYYPGNGRDFLRALYARLSNDPQIETTTIGDYIASHPGRELSRLFAGSWISHNFAIWIGHPEDNRAWDFLKEARDLIDYAMVNEPHKKDQIEKAYEEILIAEGSDWFWWFGDEHSSENDPDFDRLFRQHITNVYHFLDKPVPEPLLLPIKKPRAVTSLIYRVPRRFVSPKLDGEVSNYFEWLTAGVYYAADQQVTMHKADLITRQILFGFDLNNAYFRLDPQNKRADDLLKDNFQLQIQLQTSNILTIRLKEDQSMLVTMERERDDSWMLVEHHCEAASGSVMEVKVPFKDLSVGSGDRIAFRISILQGDILLEEHPQSGAIVFFVPGPHFEEMDWEV